MKESFPKILQMFQVRFSNLAQNKGFELGLALAVIGPNLGQHPVRLAAAASAAVTDSSWAVRCVTSSRCRARHQLARLQDYPRLHKVLHLPRRATHLEPRPQVGLEEVLFLR